MKISIVHSFYSKSSPSGENQMVNLQFSALREYGHKVQLVDLDTDDLIRKKFYNVKTAFSVATRRGQSPTKIIREFSPDIVLINNLFPNFSINWIENLDIPSIMMFHNYRHFCANALFYREGKQCFACIEKSTFQSIKYGCYRNSRLATLPIYLSKIGPSRAEWLSKSKLYFVALSEFQKNLLIAAGLDSNRISVMNNFVEDLHCSGKHIAPGSNDRWVAVGRVSKGKGFLDLALNWPEDRKLDIIGNGPDLEQLHELVKNNNNINLLGNINNSELGRMLPSYKGGFFTSLMPEVSPLSVIEFFRAGLPVIALKDTAAAGWVLSSSAGVVIDNLQKVSIRTAINIVESCSDRFRENSRNAFNANFTKSHWIYSFNKLAYRVASA